MNEVQNDLLELETTDLPIEDQDQDQEETEDVDIETPKSATLPKQIIQEYSSEILDELSLIKDDQPKIIELIKQGIEFKQTTEEITDSILIEFEFVDSDNEEINPDLQNRIGKILTEMFNQPVFNKETLSTTNFKTKIRQLANSTMISEKPETNAGDMLNKIGFKKIKSIVNSCIPTQDNSTTQAVEIEQLKIVPNIDDPTYCFNHRIISNFFADLFPAMMGSENRKLEDFATYVTAMSKIINTQSLDKDMIWSDSDAQTLNLRYTNLISATLPVQIYANPTRRKLHFKKVEETIKTGIADLELDRLEENGELKKFKYFIENRNTNRAKADDILLTSGLMNWSQFDSITSEDKCIIIKKLQNNTDAFFFSSKYIKAATTSAIIAFEKLTEVTPEDKTSFITAKLENNEPEMGRLIYQYQHGVSKMEMEMLVNEDTINSFINTKNIKLEDKNSFDIAQKSNDLFTMGCLINSNWKKINSRLNAEVVAQKPEKIIDKNAKWQSKEEAQNSLKELNRRLKRCDPSDPDDANDILTYQKEITEVELFLKKFINFTALPDQTRLVVKKESNSEKVNFAADNLLKSDEIKFANIFSTKEKYKKLNNKLTVLKTLVKMKPNQLAKKIADLEQILMDMDLDHKASDYQKIPIRQSLELMKSPFNPEDINKLEIELETYTEFLKNN